jgi:hypothetical protein
MIFSAYWRRSTFVILLIAFCSETGIGQPAPTRNDGDLPAVIVHMRHGVRTPIESETRSIRKVRLAEGAEKTVSCALRPLHNL